MTALYAVSYVNGVLGFCMLGNLHAFWCATFFFNL